MQAKVEAHAIKIEDMKKSMEQYSNEFSVLKISIDETGVNFKAEKTDHAQNNIKDTATVQDLEKLNTCLVEAEENFKQEKDELEVSIVKGNYGFELQSSLNAKEEQSHKAEYKLNGAKSQMTAIKLMMKKAIECVDFAKSTIMVEREIEELKEEKPLLSDVFHFMSSNGENSPSVGSPSTKYDEIGSTLR